MSFVNNELQVFGVHFDAFRDLLKVIRVHFFLDKQVKLVYYIL